MDHQPLLTHMTSVDPYFRLLNNIRSRQRAIKWQAMAQRGHTSASQKALSDLRSLEDIVENTLPHETDDPFFCTANRMFRKMGNTELHCQQLFGQFLTPNKYRPVDELERRVLDNLKRANTQTRIRDLKSRIILEILHKHSLGWYLIFNTLTVTDDHYQHVFEPNSRDFEYYIDRFKHAVRKATRHENRTSFEGDHSYFAVVERGDQRGRLHFHVLHFCHALPIGSSDPNRGRPVPYRRIIEQCRAFWEYGHSSPIAVRLNALDNYARLGWQWPVKYDEHLLRYEALEASNPLRLANYIAKYITKGAEERNFKWRTRTSQLFGTSIIRQSLQTMTNDSVQAMMNANSYHIRIDNLWLPKLTMQKEATREHLKRLKLNSANSSSPNDNSSLQKLQDLKDVTPQPNIVAQLRNLTQTIPIHSSEKCGSISTESTNKTAIFDAREILAATTKHYNYEPNELIARGFNNRV